MQYGHNNHGKCIQHIYLRLAKQVAPVVALPFEPVEDHDHRHLRGQQVHFKKDTVIYREHFFFSFLRTGAQLSQHQAKSYGWSMVRFVPTGVKMGSHISGNIQWILFVFFHCGFHPNHVAIVQVPIRHTWLKPNMNETLLKKDLVTIYQQWKSKMIQYLPRFFPCWSNPMCV